MPKPTEHVLFIAGPYKDQVACITFEDDTHFRVTPLRGDPLASIPIQKPHGSDVLRIGDKVRYQPPHLIGVRWENGIVKEIRPGRTDGCWVVYNCAGEWHRYWDYTGALTRLPDLRLGWK